MEAARIDEQDMVETVDGELLEKRKAHRLARRLFWAGFGLLPLLWGFNVWLFWPGFRSGSDPVLSAYTRRSAVAFTISSVLFFPWMLFYAIAGAKYMDKDLYNAIDASRLPVRDYLGF